MKKAQLIKKILIGGNWKVTAVRAAVLALIVYLVCTQLFMPFRTAGSSMEPTIGNNAFVFINKRAYSRSSPPQRGDIVAIKLAGSSVSLLKRIVGLPGEKVSIANGVVHIGGEVLEEPYLKNRGNWELKEQTLDQTQYFVIGDNRSMPMNQHKFGKVDSFRILGRKM